MTTPHIPVEIYDADVDRVDAVDGPATGMPFLILKSAAPPADLAKADISGADMNDKPDDEFAYIASGGHKDDTGRTTPRSLRHFYIGDASHVRDALSRLSQSPFGDHASSKVHAAARKFGIDVNKSQEDPTMADPTAPAPAAPDTAPVVKADDEIEVDHAPVDGPNIAGDTVDPQDALDATTPGSATWEAVDAANARALLPQLTEARAVLRALSDREQTEADSPDGGSDDQYNAYSLCDAAAAVDQAIAVLSKFAVDEQQEADAEAADAVASARAAGVIKRLTPAEPTELAKAGRVLSGANESALRQAADAIQQILAQLESAPMAAEGGEPVKVSKAAGDDSGPIPSGIQALLDQLVAAVQEYNSAVDAAQPPADPQAPQATDADPAPAEPAPEPAPDPAAAAPAPAPAPAPANPDATEQPAPPVAKAADPAEPTPVAKAADAAYLEHLESLIKAEFGKFNDRLARVEAQPVNDGPSLTGYIPGADGTAPRGDDVDSIRKALETETDPDKRIQGVAQLLRQARRV